MLIVLLNFEFSKHWICVHTSRFFISQIESWLIRKSNWVPYPILKKGRIMANRERTVNFHMYFSEEEFELLQRKVELSESNSMSEFIRRLVVYGAVFSIDFRELHETNRLLSNLTNNMNQIAHQANSCGNASNKDLLEAKRIMDDVWIEQKRYLQILTDYLPR